jgi:hypothetical protein
MLRPLIYDFALGKVCGLDGSESLGWAHRLKLAHVQLAIPESQSFVPMRSAHIQEWEKTTLPDGWEWTKVNR